MNETRSAAAFLIIVSFLVSMYLYPQMPDFLASHWNAAGAVDGYLAKSIALFMIPLISAGLFLIFVAIPKIDPKRGNISKFLNEYNEFLFVTTAFLFYVYLLTLFWNTGYRFSIAQYLSPAFAFLYFAAALLIENSKMNWFIGVRTPWTMSSNSVWDKTQHVTAQFFKGAAFLALLGFVFVRVAILLVVVPLFVSIAISIIYSYFEYRNETSGRAKAKKK